VRDGRATALEEVITDPRRVLAKCDKARVATTAAIHADLGMDLAERVRDTQRVKSA